MTNIATKKNFEQIQTNDFSTTILEVICCHVIFCSIGRLIFRNNLDT
jgi:hypothetical protein